MFLYNCTCQIQITTWVGTRGHGITSKSSNIQLSSTTTRTSVTRATEKDQCKKEKSAGHTSKQSKRRRSRKELLPEMSSHPTGMYLWSKNAVEREQTEAKLKQFIGLLENRRSYAVDLDVVSAYLCGLFKKQHESNTGLLSQLVL